MNFLYRAASSMVLLAALSWALVAQAVEVQGADLPEATDLRADAAHARRARVPILVFFSSRDCPYCRIVHEDYLKPMFNSGNYKDKLLFRMVHVDEDMNLRDFFGRMTTHREFAARSGARLTPQVRFLDHEGKELVPTLVGLMTPDFYAGILESAIDEAVSKMRNRVALSLARFLIGLP